MFLILARCPMDDVPLGTCNTEEDACHRCLLATEEDMRATVQRIAWDMPSEVCWYGFVEIVAGMPLRWVAVRNASTDRQAEAENPAAL